MRIPLIAALALLVTVAPAAANAQDVKLAPFGGQAFSAPYHVAGAPGDPGGSSWSRGPGRFGS